MKKNLVFVMIPLFFSCIDSSIRYTQFTSDDLSYLHFNSDTLVKSDKTIIYEDTITFLLNGIDLVRAPVFTKIESILDPFLGDLADVEIHGESTIEFDKQSGFNQATVHISKDYIEDVGSEKYFYIGMIGVYDDYSIFFNEYDEINLDTACVLGVHYENVLKIKPDSLSRTTVKYFYFAKGIGYIKIEAINGNTMERVLPGKWD